MISLKSWYPGEGILGAGLTSGRIGFVPAWRSRSTAIPAPGVADVDDRPRAFFELDGEDIKGIWSFSKFRWKDFVE